MLFAADPKYTPMYKAALCNEYAVGYMYCFYIFPFVGCVVYECTSERYLWLRNHAYDTLLCLRYRHHKLRVIEEVIST